MYRRRSGYCSYSREITIGKTVYSSVTVRGAFVAPLFEVISQNLRHILVIGKWLRETINK